MPELERNPLERARERRQSLEEAYGVEGKRPLSVEHAQKIYNDQLGFARDYVLRERKKNAMDAYGKRVASSIPELNRSAIIKTALDAMKRINSGEYEESVAIRKQAELLAKYDGYDFTEAFSMIGSVVSAMHKEGPPPTVDEELSEEELAHLQRVAVRMTRHAVDRNPLYKNGVFATQELVPLLGFTDTEVRIDERQRQLDLFRNKS